jgi:hypothetical protein
VEIEDLHSMNLPIAGDAERTPAWASIRECPPRSWLGLR